MSLWEAARGSRDVFTYVVTPDRIPQFIIPSLDIHKGRRLFGKGKEQPRSPGAGQPERKPRRSSSDPTVKKGCAFRGSMPCCSSAELLARMEQIPDPVTRAALSLPHLPKITTPYGFVALGQSPHVTNEEALFFHLDLAHSSGAGVKEHPAAPEQPGSCRDPGMPVAHTARPSRMRGCLRDCRLQDAQQPSCKGRKGNQGSGQPAGPPLPRRSSSPIRGSQITDVLESREAEDTEGKPKPLPLETSCQRRYSSPELPAKKPKRNFFQRILKKHFAQLRQLKSRYFPLR